jgi:putative SbcD/Mre11-related phosphoesterase
MRPLKLPGNIVLCENALFLPQEKTLVVSDLQLGQEQQLRDRGATIIYEQATQMLGLLETLIAQTDAKRVVINGDLKHEFSHINSQERRDILKVLSYLKKEVELVVVRGNHDTITKPLTDELEVALVNSWSDGGFLAVHGHQMIEIPKSVHTIIIGHTHPAIRIDDGVRNERYKCFLVAKYKDKRLIVLPSFSTIVEGSDILKVASNTPFLQGFDSSMVYVLADEVRSFGKVADLRRILG